MRIVKSQPGNKLPAGSELHECFQVGSAAVIFLLKIERIGCVLPEQHIRPFFVIIIHVWIIELDDEYNYAVVTNDTRFVLYILSRTPTLEDAVYEDLLYRVVKQGFDPDQLELTPQLEP